MKHTNMTKRYSSLLTGATRWRGIFSGVVILMLGLTVCTAHAVRADRAAPLNNVVINNVDEVPENVTVPNSQQLRAAALGSKSGISTVWHSRLGTPSSIRGNDLGRKQEFSKVKGLSLKGHGVSARDAFAVLDNLATYFRMKDVEQEMTVDRVDSDSLGFHHVRLKQSHQGVRVVGGDLIVHFDKQNRAYEVNGQYVPEISISVVPDITVAEAVRKAQTELRNLNLPPAELAGEPELVVYARHVEPTLAYEIMLIHARNLAQPGEWRFWINAVNGETLLYYNNLKHADLPFTLPTPATIFGDILEGEGGAHTNVQGMVEDDIYYLCNLAQKWCIYNVAASGYPDADSLAQRSTNDWADSDTAEMSAALNFGLIQKYFSETHGRDSFDDKGSIAVANIHQSDNLGTELVNAYWSPHFQQFFFGDGDGVSANSLAVLDVSAHEYTHAITEHTADLDYSYESGALNESFSDIFAACVEFKFQPDDRDSYPNVNPGKANWLIGEDCWLESTALRDLRNPANTNTVGASGQQPTRYKGRHWYFGKGDYGGVHYNNSVQNFFFYLLCDGGSGDNEGILYDMNGIGIANAEHIAYRALTVYCTPTTVYADARRAWLSAAQDFNDVTGSRAVRQAWRAVGINSPPFLQLSAAGDLPHGREWADYSYSIGVYSETTNCFWSLVEGSLPNGLSLDEASGVISGVPTLATTALFDVVVKNVYEEVATNSYSIKILPVHTSPYAENFDKIALVEGVPEFWTQEFETGSLSWGASQRQNDTHPAAAHSPTNFLSLFTADPGDHVTRLVSPRIDFGANPRAGRLSFYHYMEKWLNITDTLKVYYKTSQTDEWELLKTYTSSAKQWTERVIDLPAVSRQVYLAFEGTAHAGHGVCVDTVKLWDPTPPYALITPDLLPNAVIDQPYQTTIQAEGGYPPYTFMVVSNALPAGITLVSTNGVISGTASAKERVWVDIQVMDLHGETRVKTYSLAVIEPHVNLFEENFENGGQMPGWTQEFVERTTRWSIERGGHNGHPVAAHEGNYNARLFAAWPLLDDGSYALHATRLVSPRINLGQAPDNVTLSFWHCMERNGNDLDGLRVLYRTSTGSQWIELAEFNENTPEWTERSMILPDPSADYYVAFEGHARYGYGICIDTIRVTDESLAPVITTDHVLADGLIGMEYGLQMAALGGIQPYAWSLAEGSLPLGLTLSADGRLSGTPQAEYFNEFKVRIIGFDGQSSTNGFKLRIRSVPSVPFFEDFEKDGAMPRAWTQDIVNKNVHLTLWSIATGTAKLPPDRKPTTAYSGNYNASLYSNNSSQNAAKTKLITPMLDLGGGVTNAVLKFQHYMAKWVNDQDHLKVYSRTTIDGPWTLLAEYTKNTSSWTERTVALTNVSSTFFVAFESWGQYGYGICIDDVSIDGDAPDPYGTWLEDNFSSLDIDSGVDIGYFDDPDHDGILNIWEYAHLLDPNLYNTSGTPTGGVSNYMLQLIYRQNKSANDLTFVVEACTDLVLGDWSTNGVFEFDRIDQGAWWDVTAQHNVPVTNAPTRFMRLKLLID